MILSENITKLLAAGGSVCAIGLARAPGLHQNGWVKEWPNHPDWVGLPLTDIVRTASSVKVVTDFDDGECAAAWEYVAGKYTEWDSVATMSIGTGLAVGIVRCKIVISTGDGAHTLGHLPLGDPQLQCSCGQFGCLQAVLAPQYKHSITSHLALECLEKSLAWLQNRYAITNLVLTGGRAVELKAQLTGMYRGSTGLPKLEFSQTPDLSALAGAALLALQGRQIERSRDVAWIQSSIEVLQQF